MVDGSANSQGIGDGGATAAVGEAINNGNGAAVAVQTGESKGSGPKGQLKGNSSLVQNVTVVHSHNGTANMAHTGVNSTATGDSTTSSSKQEAAATKGYGAAGSTSNASANGTNAASVDTSSITVIINASNTTSILQLVLCCLY